MNSETLVRMVNDIARNFAVRGDEGAAAATADHIATFWEPRMKAALYAEKGANLSSIGRAAVDLLANGQAPPPQTSATRFNTVDGVGHGDAG